MAFSWFVQRNGDEEGPVPAARIAEMASEGSILPHDYVRRSDMEKWVPAGKVKGLSFRSSSSPTALPTPESQVIEKLQIPDGRHVELLSNGTWRFCIQEKPEATTPPQSPPSNVSTLRGFQFRKVRWGVSEREVRDSEASNPEYEATELIVYPGNVAGLSCQTCYIFVDYQLVRGKYIFTERHSNDNQ